MAAVLEYRDCKKCNERLPLTRKYFYYNPRSTTRFRGKCIPCFNEDVKARHRADPEKYNARMRAWNAANPEAARNAKLKNRYGITNEDYDRMLAEQGGGCAICGSAETKHGRLTNLYVDHCHDTGKVRGLLCYHCNTTLGYMQDDPETLRAAADYLEANSGA